MSQRWYFSVENGVVLLRSRAEGDGGLVGDAFGELRSGQTFHGVGYDELAAAKDGGTLAIAEDGSYRITAAAPLPEPAPLTIEEEAAFDRAFAEEFPE